MKKFFVKLFLIICLCSSNIYAQVLEDEAAKQREMFQPYFDNTVQKFEQADKINPPPKGAIVCVGSSSISFWHPTIVEDLAPLTIIPRGISGTDLTDVLHYADKIILPYQPRAVLVYAGENDLVSGTSPEKLLGIFLEIVEKVKKTLPETRIYFISIKPSESRWYLQPKMLETNKLIEKECTKNKNLIFIDITTAMLGENGKPKPELYRFDEIHLSKAGYAVWAAIIKPILLKKEEAFETKKEEPKKILPLKSNNEK